MTYSASNLSRRVDRMFQEVERRKRPKFIYCEAEASHFLAELQAQIDADPEGSSVGEKLTPEVEQELNDAFDSAVLWTEQTFNMRFVE